LIDLIRVSFCHLLRSVFTISPELVEFFENQIKNTFLLGLTNKYKRERERNNQSDFIAVACLMDIPIYAAML